MKRRRLLSVAGGAVTTGLAGCLGEENPAGGSDGTDGDGTSNGDTGSIFEDSFRAESTGGFIAFGEETGRRAAAMDAGFEFPSGDPIVIEGEIVADGQWESTAVEFPELRPGGGATVTIELPEGLDGELRPNGMTAAGPIRATVETPGDPASFGFEIGATTGRSNALEGETAFGNAPATATLVDNAFTVDDGTESGLVDRRIGLPAPEAGTNWFELALEFDGRDG